MKFSDYVTDGAGRFFVFGGCVESEFGHCVNDSALDWFEAIRDMGQRPVQNDIH